MKLISEKELRELFKASERLARLDVAGVDNWGYYGEALDENEDFDKSYWDWEEVDLEDLLKEYPDYSITVRSFDDNFNYE